MPMTSAAGEGGCDGQNEGAGLHVGIGAEIGPDHVQRAVGEVDEVHDAEDERQPGRDQEQHDAELHPVQQLLEDEERRHFIAQPAA